MTTIQAERTVLSSLITVLRGLRLSRSPEVAERAACRERELAAEMRALGPDREQSELALSSVGDDEPSLVVNFSKQRKEGQ